MTNGKRRAGRGGSLIQLDRNPEINQRARTPPAASLDVFATLESDGAIIGSRLVDGVTVGGGRRDQPSQHGQPLIRSQSSDR